MLLLLLCSRENGKEKARPRQWGSSVNLKCVVADDWRPVCWLSADWGTPREWMRLAASLGGAMGGGGKEGAGELNECVAGAKNLSKFCHCV